MTHVDIGALRSGGKPMYPGNGAIYVEIDPLQREIGPVQAGLRSLYVTSASLHNEFGTTYGEIALKHVEIDTFFSRGKPIYA